MGEFEFLEGVAELFAEGEAAGGAMENIGVEVENNAAVEEMANAPVIENAEGQAAVQNFIENNSAGQRIWAFAKKVAPMVGKVVEVSMLFAMVYGMLKKSAETAHATGKRIKLTEYLLSAQKTWEANGMVWTLDTKTLAATDALAFPWIDCTQ